MNDFVKKSLIANVSGFTEKLSDKELSDLTEFFCFKINVDVKSKPSNVELDFIDKVLGKSNWEDYMSDLILSPIFLKASYSFRINFDFITKLLLAEVFFRFSTIVSETKPTPKEKVVVKTVAAEAKLKPKEKDTLKEILEEHQAMLEYQLEDEDYILGVGKDGKELLAQKKRHLKFIKNFGKFKII